MPNRIRELRLCHGLSQTQLAALIGLTPHAVSQYEKDKGKPIAKDVDAMAELFDVSPGFLLGLEAKTDRRRRIPVTEGLPEEVDGVSDDVLCWYEYFRYGDYNCMYQTYGIGHTVDGRWGGEVSNGTNARVIAWMPLPEPPEEVSP